jgi:hypothetical protein
MTRYDEDGPQGAAIMPEWMWFVIIVVAWVALTQWVLPKLGVPT